MSFNTRFIESTSTKAVVDATLAALTEGRFVGTDGSFIVDTDLGEVEVNAISKKRTYLAGSFEGRPVTVSDGEHDSPFHGTTEQRAALFIYIRSLLG